MQMVYFAYISGDKACWLEMVGAALFFHLLMLIWLAQNYHANGIFCLYKWGQGMLVRDGWCCSLFSFANVDLVGTEIPCKWYILLI